MNLLIARIVYGLLLLLALPYALLHLLWRARKQPAYLRHWGERFGFYRIRPTQPLIWLHAVSVGETRAAVPLVKALQAQYPSHRILITHTTPTGRATSEALFGDSVLRAYLPYDYRFAVRRFVRHFNPALGLLMETEIWPNLIAACQQRGVPVLLVNARLSVRSARRYRKLKALVRVSLGQLSGIAAQGDTDARRLQALGAKGVEITGNLKFDSTPPPEQMVLGKQLRETFGADRAVFLAASTREGEEALVLEAINEAATPDLLTVIVPRHPQRFDEVAALLEKHHVKYQRRSANQPIAPDTVVVLGDSMGELFAYYRAADVAFIGGSLLPFGGQNLIEAAAVGCPIIVGAHVWNFTDAVRQAVACGAALQVTDAPALARRLGELLYSAPLRGEMAAAALAFSRAHRGATQRIMRMIALHLPPR
ncbi:lipid IV(A) 3-deoxy-D-manno-octulosonic acid transferase [Sulfuriferula sp.]|uniref:lipid IV(A) 3-deoxy-D-manno-octulosonic acid transferase n=1 Tax=Sulfuriferula sp. TaxID=2025307 RepID=UPI00272F93DC|nr:lipid IV(A) 3-deoxy-D-manno-octulosonic acid transferase [Sulfuriferula sp.]MDP2026816.1 lipid IV(A) 3-deoxy-D-manno-octulosonic acid transferase [Sulfuriferula sp.]